MINSTCIKVAPHYITEMDLKGHPLVANGSLYYRVAHKV